MSDKDKGLPPPEGASWVWQTLDLRESDAWRDQSINTRRFIDFLLRELMIGYIQTRENQNGALKAPDLQLRECGIGARFVAGTIEEAERLGLVDVHRHGLKVATTYGLTWLPTKDGEPATDRWREYCNPALKPLPHPEIKKSASQREGRTASPREGRLQSLPHKGKADKAQKTANLPSQGKVLSRYLAMEVTTTSLVEDSDVVADVGLAAEPLTVDGWRVPDCWLAGPQFRPALSGVAELIAARRAAAAGVTTTTSIDTATTNGTAGTNAAKAEVASETTTAIDPDAWLRDEFYTLRKRAGWVAPPARRRS